MSLTRILQIASSAAYLNFNLPARRRELNGVRKQIPDDLLQTVCIANRMTG